MSDETKNQPDNARGLRCRQCGCTHFFVVYTRPGFGGKLVRRRECRNCGKRLTTWEVAVGFPKSTNASRP
jgi:transcriptional regulator NrdR family protein